MYMRQMNIKSDFGPQEDIYFKFGQAFDSLVNFFGLQY